MRIKNWQYWDVAVLGKSTFASLLRGDLLPTQGSITLNGEPVASFGEDISEWIGVINQSPYLFHTTILNNLRIGNEEASEEEVWDVLKRVGFIRDGDSSARRFANHG